MINYDIFNNSKESINKDLSLKKYYSITFIICICIILLITKFDINMSYTIPYQINKTNQINLIIENDYQNIYINDINYNDKVVKHTSKNKKYYVTIKINGFEEYERINIKVEEKTTIMKYLINYIRKDLFNERTK